MIKIFFIKKLGNIWIHNHNYQLSYISSNFLSNSKWWSRWLYYFILFFYSQNKLLYHGHCSWFCTLLFSCSLASDSLRPHGLQHISIPCPLPSLGACSNSCPLSQWYHPTIASSVVPFSSCLLSFLSSGSFPMSKLFASGGRSTGASASTSVTSHTKGPGFKTTQKYILWLPWRLRQ